MLFLEQWNFVDDLLLSNVLSCRVVAMLPHAISMDWLVNFSALRDIFRCGRMFWGELIN